MSTRRRHHPPRRQGARAVILVAASIMLVSALGTLRCGAMVVSSGTGIARRTAADTVDGTQPKETPASARSRLIGRASAHCRPRKRAALLGASSSLGRQGGWVHVSLAH